MLSRRRSCATDCAVATAVAALAAALDLAGLRRRYRGRGAAGEGLEHAGVLGRELRPVLETVGGDEDAVRAAAEHERDDDAALGAEAQPPEPVLLEAGPVEGLLEALGALRAQRGARHGVLQRDAPADEAARHLAGRRRDLELVLALQLDDERARGDERPPALRHELEDRVEVGLAAERAPDLDHRVERRDGALELVAPRLGARVAARVVDRDPGELGEEPHGLLVLVGELRAARLVGQVQVAVGLAGDEDRDAEERRHRRVPRREAVRARVGADVLEA